MGGVHCEHETCSEIGMMSVYLLFKRQLDVLMCKNILDGLAVAIMVQ